LIDGNQDRFDVVIAPTLVHPHVSDLGKSVQEGRVVLRVAVVPLKDALIAAVRAGELDDLFSHAAKAGAIGKPKCLTGTTGRRRIVARSFFT
jgi:hypothetical protein